MSKTIWKCALAGGLIVFLWSMFSWMVLPWHKTSFNKFTDEQAVQAVIKENAPQSGVYILPNMHAANTDDGSQRAMREQEMGMLQNGPVMFASVCIDGMYKMGPTPLIISLLTQIVGAAIIAWMLLHAKYKEYGKRVWFVTVVGFLVGLLGLLPAWTWWGTSAGYTLTLWADLIIGWFLAGLLMAKLSSR